VSESFLEEVSGFEVGVKGGFDENENKNENENEKENEN